MSILLDESTNVLVQAITGQQGQIDLRRMQRYGTRVVAGVTPGKGGQEVMGVPVYDTVAEAWKHHPVDAVMSYVPRQRIKDAALEVARAGIPLMGISAERIPIHDLAYLLAETKRMGTRVVGPNTLGIASAGRALMGGIGGEMPARTLLRGPVGIMSKSGGMGAELCWTLTRAGIGQSTYVSLGGEPLSGMSFRDGLELFQADPETRVVIMFGEAGTRYEEEAADFIRQRGITKPVLAFIVGRFTENLPGVRFGHGGTIIEAGTGTPSAKIRALESAGVTMIRRLIDLPAAIREKLDGAPARWSPPEEAATQTTAVGRHS
ncbi:succinate--CoA ligase subunit alpha [Pseudochelatococcus sp. B33]